MTLTYSLGSWSLESFIIRPVQIKVYIFRHACPPWWFWGNSADRSLFRKFAFGLDLNWIGLDLEWIGKLLTSYNNIQLNTMASQSLTETKLFAGMLGPNEVSLIFLFCLCVFLFASLASVSGGTEKLSRSRSRKFSRDVLLHLSRQYAQSTGPANKANPRRPIKRARVSKE